jgi:hypothetical protein
MSYWRKKPTTKALKPYVTRCEDIAIMAALFILAVMFTVGRIYG